MKAIIKNLLWMSVCYCIAMVGVFLVQMGASPVTQRMGEAVFLIVPFSFLFFWVAMLPSGLAWIWFRDRLWLSFVAALVILLLWGLVMSLFSTYQVRPGYFGRAIDDGMPTIHYFIDLLVEFGLAVTLYELSRLFWKRGARHA